VIALDQDAANQDSKPTVARTATLEVTPIEAQKLALGQRIGEISLVLRRPGAAQDDPFVQTVNLNDLRYGRYESNAVAPTAVKLTRPATPVSRVAAPRRNPVRRSTQPLGATPKPANNVEVVRGTTGTNYDVGNLRG
jgi:pilus assembly protein CpaB